MQEFRAWKRKYEPDWIAYQFRVQTAEVNARKIPGEWSPDQVRANESPGQGLANQL